MVLRPDRPAALPDEDHGPVGPDRRAETGDLVPGVDRERGDLAFVIPQGKLDALRQELRSLVHARLLTETIQQENRLPEQRGIEASREQIVQTITSLEEQQRERSEQHRKTSASFYGSLAEVRKQLAVIRAEPLPLDAIARTARETRLRDLEREERRLRNAITSEQQTFEARDRNLTQQLDQQRSAYSASERQEQQLTDRVATIRGTIAFDRLDYGAFASELLRAHWIGTLLGFVALLAAIRWWRDLDRDPLEIAP